MCVLYVLYVLCGRERLKTVQLNCAQARTSATTLFQHDSVLEYLAHRLGLQHGLHLRNCGVLAWCVSVRVHVYVYVFVYVFFYVYVYVPESYVHNATKSKEHNSW